MIWGNLYIYHKSAFNLFEDSVLKIEYCLRGPMPVAHMLAQYRHTSVTFCHGLVNVRQMSRCTVHTW